jgi:magnesium transporter
LDEKSRHAEIDTNAATQVMDAAELASANAATDQEVLGMDLPVVHLPNPGAGAGIEHHEITKLPSQAGETIITCIDYSAEKITVEKVEDLEFFMIYHRPEWASVRWINVDGLSDMNVIHAFAEKYDIHPLAVEDILSVGNQRPKVDYYGDEGVKARLFMILRMVEMKSDHIATESIAMILGHKTIITFQPTPGDVWDNVRQRLQSRGNRLRSADASFLAYTLIDAMVDNCYPILEYYGERLETLEEEVIENPQRPTIMQIHAIKRELLLLRRALWPMRDVVMGLQRESHECLSAQSQTYLRDAYDHVVILLEMIDTYREVGTGLTEIYMSSLSNRMNEIMKVLTLMTSIFVPLTFLAGVYGMNFKFQPEFQWEWSYPIFWGICITLATIMIVWFRRRGWISSRK